MKRKNAVLVVLMLFFSVLVGCSSKKSLTDYITLSFSGINGRAKATYKVDKDKLISDVYGVSSLSDIKDFETMSNIDKLVASYEITLENDVNLSNDDEVKITIKLNDFGSKKLSDKSKTIKVEGLLDGTPLTDAEIKENVIVNFEGYSGKGKIEVDNIFKTSPLNSLYFGTESDGSIKNGDMVIVKITNEDMLYNNKYNIADTGSLEVEAKGLIEVADVYSNIENFDSVKTFLDQELEDKYTSSFTDYTYETKGLYYRQFQPEGTNMSGFGNGSLGYVVEVVSDKGKSYERTSTIFFGIKSIEIDSEKSANISKLSISYNYSFKNSYTLETIQQFLAGEDFVKVEQ